MNNSIQSVPAERSMRDKIVRLQDSLRGFPQIELETKHYFADGMYCRSVRRPAGALIVGKVHRKEHLYMIVSGEVKVIDEFGERLAKAPAVFISKPGTKRAVLAITDATCLTVHRTDKTDLDEIEAELIEDDPTSLFDSSNKLRSVIANDIDAIEGGTK